MVILQNTHEPTVGWTHTADNMHKLIKCRGGWQLSGCDGLSLHTVSLCTVKQYVEKVHAICHGCDGLSLHTVSLCTVKQCAESPSHPPSPSGPQCQASSSQPLNLFTVDNHHSWLRGRERRGTAAGFARSCSIKGHSSSSSSQLHSEFMLVTGAHDSAAVRLDWGPFCSS